MNCINCWASYYISDNQKKYIDKFAPTFWWEKFQIPLPLMCEWCRQIQRLAWKNERKLYKRTCSKTWKPIISIYSPEKSNKVYAQDVRLWNDWNVMDYWKLFDFTKWLFEQLNTLIIELPQMNMVVLNSENCEFNNDIVWCKNAYMCFWSSGLEDVYHTSASYNVKKSSDIW